MPELHQNQIAWEAPEPRKVAYDKPDYTPLAEALNYLSNQSQNLSDTIQGHLDNQIIKDLNDLKTQTDDAIDKEESLNANYEYMADEAIDKWQKKFDEYDEATQTRFLRANPNAKEMFEIAVKDKAIKKRQEQIYNRSKLDIAQWSRDVISAPKELQDEVLKEKQAQIQNLKLPIKMTDNLLFELQNEVDIYSITKAISDRDYKTANYLLDKKNGKLPTIGAAQEAQYRIQLKAQMEADSREKALEQKALAEAKEAGKDADSSAILQLHQQLLMQNQIDAADQLRRNYYYGRDIPIYGDNGEIVNVVHSADTNPVLRDKLFNTMETSAKRNPGQNEYVTEYKVDFNRLSSGLMEPDGSLKEDIENITPEQYSLAKKLKRQNDGWNTLTTDQRVFVNNVLRSFGTEAGLWMIDLNPNTQLKATTIFGTDVQKANPVVNYQALLNLYNTPAAAIASLTNPDQQLTGREVYTMSYFVDKYEDEKFKDDYEITKGTRADALVALFTEIATHNNPYGMKDVGLGMIPREIFESEMVDYLTQMKRGGHYDDQANYQDLVADFKNVYKMTTGINYAPPKDQNPLQKYALLAVASRRPDRADYDVDVAWSYANKLPKDPYWNQTTSSRNPGILVTNEYNEALYRDNKAAVLERDRQYARSLEGGQVSTYEPKTGYNSKESKEKARIKKLEEEAGGAKSQGAATYHVLY